MSINFQPDTCLPRDPPGWGQWLTGHYYEHLVMRQACAALTPPVYVPDYDILSWSDDPAKVQQWLVNHQSMHVQLESACNITGIDFSLVDFSKDDEFSEWQDDHAQEHQTIRSILGIM